MIQEGRKRRVRNIHVEEGRKGMCKGMFPGEEAGMGPNQINATLTSASDEGDPIDTKSLPHASRLIFASFWAVISASFSSLGVITKWHPSKPDNNPNDGNNKDSKLSNSQWHAARASRGSCCVIRSCE